MDNFHDAIIEKAEAIVGKFVSSLRYVNVQDFYHWKHNYGFQLCQILKNLLFILKIEKNEANLGNDSSNDTFLSLFSRF